jgi:hypothetical protein
VLPARNGHRIAAVVWTQPAKASLVTLKVITARDGKNSEAFGLNLPVTGKIDPRSVRLHGLNVSFTENGRTEASNWASRNATHAGCAHSRPCRTAAPPLCRRP